MLAKLVRTAMLLPGAVGLLAFSSVQAKPVKQDYQIEGADPGVRLFVRQKMEEGNSRFTDDNIVLFIHGATAPWVGDFALAFKDYSWADWMISQGYVPYLFDKRNYGYSSREKAMDEPAASNKPVSRSYQVIRDIGSVVAHIPQKHKVAKVTLIGWSWGAMTAGYYA